MVLRSLSAILSLSLSSSKVDFVETIGFETILGRNTILLFIIVFLVFLSIIDHTFNFLSTETTFIIGDGDLFLFASSLLDSRNIENAIGINVKSNLNLWNSSGCWRDAFQIKLSK